MRLLSSILPAVAIWNTSSTSRACRLETPVIVISLVTKRQLLMVNGRRPLAKSADNRCRAAGSRSLNDLIGGFRIADGFECLVDAAVRKLSGFLHRIRR